MISTTPLYDRENRGIKPVPTPAGTNNLHLFVAVQCPLKTKGSCKMFEFITNPKSPLSSSSTLMSLPCLLTMRQMRNVSWRCAETSFPSPKSPGHKRSLPLVCRSPCCWTLPTKAYLPWVRVTVLNTVELFSKTMYAL